MEGWEAQLQSEFERHNNVAATEIKKLRTKLKYQLKTMRCGKCSVKTLEGDLVSFKCPSATSDAPHVLCFDCLADRMERQRGYLERTARAKLKVWPVLRKLVLCFECHCPHVIDTSVVFESGLAQNRLRLRGRQHFTINEDMTKIVLESQNYVVHTYYENQRRGMFTKFGSEHLMKLDSCTATSTENGTPLKLSEIQPSTNALWMEDWTCDAKNTGDPQGWQFAFNWPNALLSIGGWEHSASLTTFVRRRKMLRTAVVLDARLRPPERGPSMMIGSRRDLASAAAAAGIRLPNR